MHKKNVFVAIAVLILTLLLVSACGNNSNTKTTAVSLPPTAAKSTTTNQSDKATGKMTVHFLDVGQADSIYIHLPNNQNMLIDAGNNDDGAMVVSYLQKNGVKKIDYLVGTHPHEDHIGGLDNVIESFDIGKVYMPKVTHTTKTYRDVLKAIQTKKLKITPAKAGIEIINTNGLKATLLAPCGTNYEELNNYSAIVKVSFGKISFLFTGDAEELSEMEMIQNGANLKADILKVGHHGSHSSSSKEFLNAVNPKVAVISTGAGNDYGHPHKETLKKLAAAKVSTYRTDQCGTIVISTDGKNYTINVTKQANEKLAVLNSSKTQGMYLGSIKSNKYHSPDCPHVKDISPQNIIWFKDATAAKAAGYKPCNFVRAR